MIPAGAVLANVCALLWLGKLLASKSLFLFVGGPILDAIPISLVGAILGALSVLFLWPEEEHEETAASSRQPPSHVGE